MVGIRISLLTSPELEISVIWSPGHVGIIGNEKADKMAEQGTRLESVALGGPFAHAKQLSKAKGPTNPEGGLGGLTRTQRLRHRRH